MNIVNPSNPFQLPTCLQRADSQQRRRERFKKTFIAAIVAVVILLVGLLIEGCMSEKATTSAPNVAQNTQTTSVAGRLPPRQQETLVAQTPPQTSGVPEVWTHPPVEPPPQPVSQPVLNTGSRTAPPVATEKPVSNPTSETIYVVKSGDSLTRIAKVHGTTVQALKATNGLKSDRIVVGAKLKIPTA